MARADGEAPSSPKRKKRVLRGPARPKARTLRARPSPSGAGPLRVRPDGASLGVPAPGVAETPPGRVAALAQKKEAHATPDDVGLPRAAARPGERRTARRRGGDGQGAADLGDQVGSYVAGAEAEAARSVARRTYRAVRRRSARAESGQASPRVMDGAVEASRSARRPSDDAGGRADGREPAPAGRLVPEAGSRAPRGPRGAQAALGGDGLPSAAARPGRRRTLRLLKSAAHAGSGRVRWGEGDGQGAGDLGDQVGSYVAGAEAEAARSVARRTYRAVRRRSARAESGQASPRVRADADARGARLGTAPGTEGPDVVRRTPTGASGPDGEGGGSRRGRRPAGEARGRAAREPGFASRHAPGTASQAGSAPSARGRDPRVMEDGAPARRWEGRRGCASPASGGGGQAAGPRRPAPQGGRREGDRRRRSDKGRSELRRRNLRKAGRAARGARAAQAAGATLAPRAAASKAAAAFAGFVGSVSAALAPVLLAVAAVVAAFVAVAALLVTLFPFLFGEEDRSAGALTGNVAQVARAMLEAGWSQTQTAAALGNMRQECGEAFDPSALEEPGLGVEGNFANGSRGVGICQWTTASEKAGLLAKASAMGRPWDDLDVQVAYLLDEIGDPGKWGDDVSGYRVDPYGEYGDPQSGQRVVVASLATFRRDDGNLEALVGDYCFGFLRPGAPRLQKRVDYAREYLSLMQAGQAWDGTVGGQEFAAATEAQKGVVRAATAGTVPGAVSYCAGWVCDVFEAAGRPCSRLYCANDYYRSFCTSSDPADLKVGMIVAYPSSYGHIGIYIGDGKTISCDSNSSTGWWAIQVHELSDWPTYFGSEAQQLRWGWMDGNDLSRQ